MPMNGHPGGGGAGNTYALSLNMLTVFDPYLGI